MCGEREREKVCENERYSTCSKESELIRMRELKNRKKSAGV